MNTVSRLTLFVLLAFTFACTPTIEIKQEAQAVLNTYEEALRSKSSEQIAAMFTQDATILAEGKPPVEGRVAVQEHFKGLERLDFEEQFTLEDSFQAGEYLVLQTKNEGKYSPIGKEDYTSFAVKSQMILKQENQEWKIHRYAYSGNQPTAEPTRAIEGDFAHIVIFWLKDESEEGKLQFRTELEEFITSSKYVSKMHIGTPANTPREVVDNSYTFCLISTFASKAEQDKYQAEQVHLDFIEKTKNLWSKLQIYDSVRQ